MEGHSVDDVESGEPIENDGNPTTSAFCTRKEFRCKNYGTKIYINLRRSSTNSLGRNAYVESLKLYCFLELLAVFSVKND